MILDKVLSVFFILLTFISSTQTQVTPEQFGAVGNGIVDDTYSLQRALKTNLPVILNGTYLISNNITLSNNISGKGTILFNKDNLSIVCGSDNVIIKGITFDYQGHEGKTLRIQNANNVSIDRCSFCNVGNPLSKQSVGCILINKSSSFITIRNCKFIHCCSSEQYSATGVWVNYSTENDRCHHIYISKCVFDDFQPSKDADAIKVIGQNYNTFLFVSDCKFKGCDKRAMKFQSRECHSSNNQIFVNRPMYCAIDFQRGHGTSYKDKIILEYDRVSTINPNSGLLYRGISIAQGDVTVRKLKITMRNQFSIPNPHQIVFGVQSFPEFDNGEIDNITINKCKVKGMASILSLTENVKQVSNLQLNQFRFDGVIQAPELKLRDAIIHSSSIEFRSAHGHPSRTIQPTNYQQVDIIRK